METKSIKHLAYFMKEAKSNNLPSPIFFLGAGASKSGEIPLANEIIADILGRYPDNPDIKSLGSEERTYPKLMECLGPTGRNKLLKEYIEKSKINVTHIYLAQLMRHGYVDYVLTVNFDNLMLRALALLNEFPATYDMAILKDLTTTTFKEKSVVYLHGQHHGLWLLNTTAEMEKVSEVIPPILNKISNERPWVFIGYSVEDPVFKHIKNLGRFDNGLYWVTYKDNDPVKPVCEALFEQPNTNAFSIKGYDADAFMLKLNSELELPQPFIVDKPFSSLSLLLDNIDDQEHFKGVKERLVLAKNQVNQAILQYEEGEIESPETSHANSEIGLLMKEIIALILNEDYQSGNISKMTLKAKELKSSEINHLLAGLYSNWGNNLGGLANSTSNGEAEALYQQAFEKYQQAIAIKSDFHEVLYNWGNHLGELAKSKSGEEVEALYQQAFAKFKTAIELGASSYNLACLYAVKLDKENALFYLDRSLKNKEINDDFVKADEDWASYLQDEDFNKILRIYVP